MSARSTAGVAVEGPCDWLALVAADTGYQGALFCLAAGVAATGDRRTGMYGVGVATLSRLVRQKPKRVRAGLVTLVADGWLIVARRGGGRGRPTLYQLALPGLIAAPAPADSGSLGTQYPIQTGSLGTQFVDETRSLEALYPQETGAPGTLNRSDTGYERTQFRPPSPLVSSLNVERERSGGGADQTDPVQQVAAQVLEHGLRPAGAHEMRWLLEAIQERLQEAPADELVARFRFHYDPKRPNGFAHASTAFLTCTKRPLTQLERAAAQPARGTPTPDRFVGRRIELQPEVAAAGAAAARAQMRGGAS